MATDNPLFVGFQRVEGAVQVLALRLKQHLADVLAVLNEMMRRGSFVELEDPGDLRFDRTDLPQAE